MYFIMKDYSKSDINRLGVYIDELPIELGYYDSFRITCVDTNDTVIYTTTPSDKNRKTKSVVFVGLDDYDLVNILVEYKLIGDKDYIYLGNYVFSVQSAIIDDVVYDGTDKVKVDVLHIGNMRMDGGKIGLINI